MSQLFTSGGQSIEASDTASVLPRNIQSSFLLGLTGLISLLSDAEEKVPPGGMLCSGKGAFGEMLTERDRGHFCSCGFPQL